MRAMTCARCGTSFESMAATARYEEVERMMIEAHGVLDGAVGSSHRYTRRAVDSLVALHEAVGKPDRAAEWSSRRMPAAATGQGPAGGSDDR